MSSLAKAEIQGLKQAGIEPTLDEIVWLNDLARRVEYPDPPAPLAMGQPVPIGGDWLWPFTIQADRWWRRTLDWFDGREELEAYALAYALAHGRIANAFDYLYTAESAARAIGEWADGLTCSRDELMGAIEKILNKPSVILDGECDDDDDSCPGPEDNDEQLVAWLVAGTGLPVEYWVRECSRAYCMAQIRAVQAQSAAFGSKPSLSDPSVAAQRELGRAVLAIKEAHANG